MKNLKNIKPVLFSDPRMASSEMHSGHFAGSIWIWKGMNRTTNLGFYDFCIQTILGLRILFEQNDDDVVVSRMYLAELQRRVLKAEVGVREKDEEREILLQRIQQYENRWSDYEQKMTSMEELWQKQMNSLQSSLSLAKQSLSNDDDTAPPPVRNNEIQNGGGASEMTAGLSLISRLAEEFEQRSQVFGDDARFLVEVKSGQAEADLDPEQELRRLKQVFEGWKKDYAARLRETKVILNRLSSEEASGGDKVKKNWWGRLNSSRVN